MTEANQRAANFLEQFEPEVFWQQHGRKILWGIVAALAVVVVVVQIQRQAAEREIVAAARLSQTSDPSALARLAQEFQQKPVGAQALFQLAAIHLQAGRLAEAAAADQEFLTLYPQHPLADGVRLSQATTLESNGKFEEARAKYQLLAAQSGSYVSIPAKLGAARCAETLGQTKEARQLYEELAPVVTGTIWEVPVALRLDVLTRILGTTLPAATTGIQKP